MSGFSYPLLPTGHLLAIEGLEPPHIAGLLDLAENYALLNRQGKTQRDLLKGRTLINLFFEDSTRTRTSFELAGKRLGADIVNMSVSTSSVNKGETLLDTAATLNAMHTDLLVIRHAQSGAPALLAQKVDAAVINAGDGTHEHPTQGLLDVFTIREKKGRVDGLNVTILGDILYSRVARSNIWALTKLGAKVTLCGPPTLVPKSFESFAPNVRVTWNIDEALRDADVINLLRIQHERQKASMFPSTGEYAALFGLNTARMTKVKSDALIMHPGPINRGVEIASSIADGPQSVILEQVTNGLAVRMAALYLVNGGASLQVAG
jgi:aspartate carbamoyltransferase catalytic subunit